LTYERFMEPEQTEMPDAPTISPSRQA